MAESKVFGLIGTGFSAFSSGAFFAFNAGAVIIGFSACLFLSVFKSGYGLKKRLWYLLVVLICVSLLKLRASVVGEKDISSLLLFFGVALFLPVYFIREKTPKTHVKNESAREYVRFLENKINRAAGEKEFSASAREKETDLNPEVIKAEKQQQNSVDKPDFSHVKNVLQRLEPALLSYADRRQIHELELSIYEAEHGEYSEETRRKINEGLGNLLKIMARHGV